MDVSKPTKSEFTIEDLNKLVIDLNKIKAPEKFTIELNEYASKVMTKKIKNYKKYKNKYNENKTN